MYRVRVKAIDLVGSFIPYDLSTLRATMTTRGAYRTPFDHALRVVSALIRFLLQRKELVMPNWCSNDLTITTKTPKQFVKLIQGITNDSDQPFDFNRIIPTPQELLDSSSPNRTNPQEMKDKYGYEDWYNFRCARWGTKWNACDVEMRIESPTEVSISFNTAWSPPMPVIEAIAQKYPFADITLSFYEEGMGFAGEVVYSKGQLVSESEQETTCEWRIEKWGECYEGCENCGSCDCECGCEQTTQQTICSDCNDNDHQNNNELPQFTNKEQRKEINA
jgi:hypothetical protein